MIHQWMERCSLFSDSTGQVPDSDDEIDSTRHFTHCHLTSSGKHWHLSGSMAQRFRSHANMPLMYPLLRVGTKYCEWCFETESSHPRPIPSFHGPSDVEIPEKYTMVKSPDRRFRSCQQRSCWSASGADEKTKKTWRAQDGRCFGSFCGYYAYMMRNSFTFLSLFDDICTYIETVGQGLRWPKAYRFSLWHYYQTITWYPCILFWRQLNPCCWRLFASNRLLAARHEVEENPPCICNVWTPQHV